MRLTDRQTEKMEDEIKLNEEYEEYKMTTSNICECGHKEKSHKPTGCCKHKGEDTNTEICPCKKFKPVFIPVSHGKSKITGFAPDGSLNPNYMKTPKPQSQEKVKNEVKSADETDVTPDTQTPEDKRREKSIYDKDYYIRNTKKAEYKKLRQRALILLSHSFPKHFKIILEGLK